MDKDDTAPISEGSKLRKLPDWYLEVQLFADYAGITLKIAEPLLTKILIFTTKQGLGNEFFVKFMRECFK